MKAEGGEVEWGEQTLGNEGAWSTPFDPSMRRTCCAVSPTSYDSNSLRSRDSDVYVSKLNTGNTSVQMAVSPKHCGFQSVHHSKGDSLRQSYDFKQTTTSIVICWWIPVKPNRLVSRRDTSWSMLLIVGLFLIKNQTRPDRKDELDASACGCIARNRSDHYWFRGLHHSIRHHWVILQHHNNNTFWGSAEKNGARCIKLCDKC